MRISVVSLSVVNCDIYFIYGCLTWDTVLIKNCKSYILHFFYIKIWLYEILTYPFVSVSRGSTIIIILAKTLGIQLNNPYALWYFYWLDEQLI